MHVARGHTYTYGDVAGGPCPQCSPTLRQRGRHRIATPAGVPRIDNVSLSAPVLASRNSIYDARVSGMEARYARLPETTAGLTAAFQQPASEEHDDDPCTPP